MNCKKLIVLSAFIFLFFTFLFFPTLGADIISVNPTGSQEHAMTPEKFIEGFFSFFKRNHSPEIDSVLLNSTSGNNLTNDNLTVYYSGVFDRDGDNITNITDWRKNSASIAVLNMPFDTYIYSTASGAVKDYSTYGNNGTLGGGNSAYAPTWNASGKIGGAYSFDGVNDYVSVAKSGSLNFSTGGFSISGWVYVAGEPNLDFPAFVEKGTGDFSDTHSNQKGFFLSVAWVKAPARNIRFCVGNGSGYNSVTPSVPNDVLLGKWNHVVAVADSQFSSNPQLRVYMNGTLIGSTARTYLGPIDYEKVLDIGRWSIGRYFNGSFDEIAIWNRTLTGEQIRAMYLAGVANHSVELMVSNETTKGETWQVAVTPNDGKTDGETILSNNLTIAMTSVFVNLTSPLDRWYTNDNILFDCNASSDVYLKNSSAYTNYSGTWGANVTNTSLSGFFTSVLLNGTGFGTEKTFLWNCLFCDVEHSCNFSSSNRTLTTDLTKSLIDFVSPTNSNATKKPSSENYSYVNVSSSDASNNFSVLTDWNRSLVGWWRLEAGNGTHFVDSSSYGNNGTCSGTTCPNLTTGVRGKAYKFDGVNDSVNTSLSFPSQQYQLTVSVWEYHSSPQGVNDVIVANYHQPFGVQIVSSDLDANVKGTIRQSDGTYLQPTVTGGLQSNRWNNFVLVYNGSAAFSYVNGILRASVYGNYLPYMNGTQFVRLASWSATEYHFNGSIDEVQIYNRALSAQEINASYQASLYKYYNNFTSLNPGTYKYTSYAFDQAGNLNNTEERYFILNNKPTGPTSVILNATSSGNLTTDNLTLYYSGVSDLDSDNLTNITDWRKNGTSLAVLNMPFDTNLSSNASGAVKDYSTYGNNGTLGGGTSAYAPTWNASGKIGGAYTFDGVNDYVQISNSLFLNPSVLTVSVWAKSNTEDWNSWGMLVSKRNAYVLHPQNGSKAITFYVRNSTDTGWVSVSAVPDSITEWHNYIGTFDGVSLKIYVDGQMGDSVVNSQGINTEDTGDLYIGWDDGIGGRFFNGSIDEVQIFNYSLSPEQIRAMYLAGVANHSVEVMVSNETLKGETWQVAVTPNDKYEDGTTVLSNNLVVANTPPVVVLYSPENGNVTSNRTPAFYWNGSDSDGDSLTYELNLTCYNSLGGSCSDDDRLVSGLSAQNYTLTTYLEYLKDNNYYYNWTVRAHDGTTYGEWASPARKIEIQASLDVILINDSISFGSMGMDESKNTTENNPYPFSLQNNGNCFANVSINATQLWNTVSSASDTYQFKADNLTGEEGAFEWLASKFSWTQMPITGETVAISKLNFTDSRDSAEVDILVTVPNQEPYGDRESTVYFPVSLGE